MGRINQLTPTTIVTTDSVIAVDAANGGVTNKLTINTLAGGLRVIGNYATQAQLAAKQDVLTFDDAPEEDSDNPVTSGGIYNAIGSAMSNVYTKAETDSAIAQSTASKAGVVTMITGTSNLTVRQSGNTVYIGGWVSNATITANAEVKIADISGVSLPPDSVRAFCNVGANAYSVGTLSYITLGTGGSLYVISSNGGTGKAIYFDICYVANN